jgi:hypothetical protein
LIQLRVFVVGGCKGAEVFPGEQLIMGSMIVVKTRAKNSLALRYLYIFSPSSGLL